MTNFRRPRPVRLLLRGRERRAETTAVEDREQVAALLEVPSHHYGPWVIQDPNLRLPRNRLPTHREVLEAASTARIARFRLSDRAGDRP